MAIRCRQRSQVRRLLVIGIDLRLLAAGVFPHLCPSIEMLHRLLDHENAVERDLASSPGKVNFLLGFTEERVFSPYLYRARNLIERFFNKIKQCPRVATRYDKLAANYLAFIKLASIRIWLRANESAPWIASPAP